MTLVKLLHAADTPTQTAGLDRQLDDEAFESYCGIDIQAAKDLCVREDLDFDEEFWEPYITFVKSLAVAHPELIDALYMDHNEIPEPNPRAGEVIYDRDQEQNKINKETKC